MRKRGHDRIGTRPNIAAFEKNAVLDHGRAASGTDGRRDYFTRIFRVRRDPRDLGDNVVGAANENARAYLDVLSSDLAQIAQRRP